MEGRAGDGPRTAGSGRPRGVGRSRPDSAGPSAPERGPRCATGAISPGSWMPPVSAKAASLATRLRGAGRRAVGPGNRSSPARCWASRRRDVASAAGPSADLDSPDGRSRDGRSPDGRSRDGRSPVGRPLDAGRAPPTTGSCSRCRATSRDRGFTRAAVAGASGPPTAGSPSPFWTRRGRSLRFGGVEPRATILISCAAPAPSSAAPRESRFGDSSCAAPRRARSRAASISAARARWRSVADATAAVGVRRDAFTGSRPRPGGSPRLRRLWPNDASPTRVRRLPRLR